MKNVEKALLVPGTLEYVSHYKGFSGIDIWDCSRDEQNSLNAEYIIGHSLGVGYILNAGFDEKKKFVFVNPLIKKRSKLNLFVRWVKFLIFEGFKGEELVPIKCWVHVLKQMLFLLKVDVLSEIHKIPKENVFVIRGKQDDFFCDQEDVDILRKNNFKVIEVDAGHDWNDNIAKTTRDIIEA